MHTRVHKYLLYICHFNLKRCDAHFCDANSRRSNVPRANDTLRNTFLILVDASSHARYHWRIYNRISHRRISVVKPRAFCEMPCDPYRYKWAPFARAPTVWRDEYTLESTINSASETLGHAVYYIRRKTLVYRRRDPRNLWKCSSRVKFPLKFERDLTSRLYIICSTTINYLTMLLNYLTRDNIGYSRNNTFSWLVWRIF